jgi:hypothetical protein
MGNQKWVSILAKGTIRISDVRELQGEVPEPFRKCFIGDCGRPAVYIICAVSDDPKLQKDTAFSDAAAEALAQELRAEFGTNLELPVCELHLDGSVPQ